MRLPLFIVALAAVTSAAPAAELAVGPGQAFGTIVQALAKALAGDTIVVHPLDGNKPYEGVAVMVRKDRITIKAAGPGRVTLTGKDFNYTGAGPVPRAIFQFDPQGGGCVLEGFELTGAHNDSHNGAGVRINQANHVTIRNCEIHGCDMGIMSNGDGAAAGADQRIENCRIYANGSDKEPGQNHNLYLGGHDVTLTACEVCASVTGHNVKSRAHLTRVMYSYIHDSANREFDLVDAKGDTSAANSDAVLVGNVIVKDPRCSGNRAVIHFGQDVGNEHNGTLYAVHNTIVTPFISPVVDLSAAGAGVKFINNIIWDGGSGQVRQELVKIVRGGKAENLSGISNWMTRGFFMPEGAKFESTFVAAAGAMPPFADAKARDYHLAKSDAAIIAAGLPWSKIVLPAPAEAVQNVPPPLLQYKSSLTTEPRPGFKPDAKPDLGAFGFAQVVGSP